MAKTFGASPQRWQRPRASTGQGVLDAFCHGRAMVREMSASQRTWLQAVFYLDKPRHHTTREVNGRQQQQLGVQWRLWTPMAGVPGGQSPVKTPQERQ